MTSVGQATQNRYNSAVRRLGPDHPVTRKLARDLAVIRFTKVAHRELPALDSLDANQRAAFLRMPPIRRLEAVLRWMRMEHARDIGKLTDASGWCPGGLECLATVEIPAGQDDEGEYREIPSDTGVTRRSRHPARSLLSIGQRKIPSDTR